MPKLGFYKIAYIFYIKKNRKIRLLGTFSNIGYKNLIHVI